MIELLLAVVLFTAPPQSPEGWKGIVPLVTQRSEVEKILGVPGYACEGICRYDIGGDRIFVRYVGEPCSKENKWTIPSGTVFEISVYPGDDRKFSSLKIDRRKFKKTEDPELHGYFWYDNEQQGIIYSVQEGSVTGIYWYGTAERHKKSLCPSVKANSPDRH